ncbi:hypothetical protein RRG08_053485 [Elysia crispata]|uniref:Uncharacterized protein n=1 Tax=Elysia crispata TaxID=231223 RepID=A0AAE1A176_9GAST|nr:hypothetical protein RRG08_053485 [Elysia crispata]
MHKAQAIDTQDGGRPVSSESRSKAPQSGVQRDGSGSPNNPVLCAVSRDFFTTTEEVSGSTSRHPWYPVKQPQSLKSPNPGAVRSRRPFGLSHQNHRHHTPQVKHNLIRFKFYEKFSPKEVSSSRAFALWTIRRNQLLEGPRFDQYLQEPYLATHHNNLLNYRS